MNNVRTFKNGVNIMSFIPCEVPKYNKFMQLQVAANINFKGGSGKTLENLTNALATFLNENYYGIVVFEENQFGEKKNISENAIQILVHSASKNNCRIEIYNEKRVFIYE